MKKTVVIAVMYLLKTGLILGACSFDLQAQQVDTLVLEEASRFDGEFAHVINQGTSMKLHRSGLLVDDRADRHENGNIVVRKGGNYGVIAKDGQLIVPFSYDDIRFQGSYIRLRSGENYGLADSIGNVLVAVEHADVRQLTEQVAGVSDGQHWALIALHGGKLLSDFDYDNVLYSPNSERLITVQLSGKWGLVDELGHIRTETHYSRISRYSDNPKRSAFFAWYCENEEGGVRAADRHGFIITEGYYDRIDLAGEDERTAVGFKGNTLSLLDLETSAVKATYTGIFYGFIDSLAVVDQNGKFGVIDLDGRQVLPFGYEKLGYVYDRYPADYGQSAELATRFNDPFTFKEDLQTADSNPTMVAPKIRYILAEKGEEVHVHYPDGRLHTVIDYPAQGHMVLNGQFFLLVGDKGLLGLSDLDGKLSAPIKYNDMVMVSEFFYQEWGYLPHASYDEYLYVRAGDSVGVYHVSGRETVEAKWQNVFSENDRFFRVFDDGGRSGMINFEGQLIFPLLDQVQYNIVAGNRIVKTSSDAHGNKSSVLLDETGKVLYTNPLWDYQYTDEEKITYQDGLLKLSGQDLTSLFVDTLGMEHRFDGYDYVGSFTKGIAVVIRGGYIGFIGRDGGEIIPPSLEFLEGNPVAAGTDAHTVGLVYEYGLDLMIKEDPLVTFRRDGQVSLLSFEQDTVTCLFTHDEVIKATYGYSDRYYTVKSGGLLGLHHADGRLVYPAAYDGIRVYLPEHLVELQQEGQYGLGNTDGTIIVPVRYDEIEKNKGLTMSGRFPVAVAEDGHWFFIDEQGKKLPVIIKKLSGR